MTRFRCPSSSTLSSSRSYGSLSNIKTEYRPKKRNVGLATVEEDQAPVAGPSTARPAAMDVEVEEQPVAKRDNGKGKTRTHQRMDVGQKEKLRMAKKKAEIKVHRPPQAQWSFVFVGNVNSSVTEAQLEALFQQCGTVRRILIRASSGICVPTTNLKRGFLGFGGVQPGVHYATVEYWTPAEARRALELNGTVLEGRSLVVSLSAIDLPEMREVITSHIVKKDPHQQKRSLWQAKFGQLKRLTIERTELVVPDGERRGGGPAKFLEGVAMRLGLYDPAGNTAAEAHQKTASGPSAAGLRHPSPLAKLITSPFPKTLV
ncbi:hypothetical protein BN946_scf185043.g63 [Trametes cinnabarina]|uniref:RRM domain-containing protein n=1 Tax=Pycnoporus cinnabarinus TaxID=5643 RepID=A0A060SP54_PYCCI|nr:hypothetical protein BN946_scf185043.g63 [Trametes cinnabarina]